MARLINWNWSILLYIPNWNVSAYINRWWKRWGFEGILCLLLCLDGELTESVNRVAVLSFLIQTDLLIGSIFNWSVQSAAINRRVSLLRSIREARGCASTWKRVHVYVREYNSRVIHATRTEETAVRENNSNYPKFLSRQARFLLVSHVSSPPPFVFSIIRFTQPIVSHGLGERGSIEGGPFFHAGNNLRRENEV